MPTSTGSNQNAAKEVELFVNRTNSIKMFGEAVAAIKSDRAEIAVFFGAGGQGKTELCKKFGRLLETGSFGSDLRWGMIDLQDRSEKDPVYLLIWIRNALRKSGHVRFPAFDFAVELYWNETYGRQMLPLADHFWWDEAQEGLGNVIAEATPLLLEGVPFLGSVLSRLGRHATRLGRKEYLKHTNDALKQLYKDGQLLAPRDVGERLPGILVQDLWKWQSTHNDAKLVILVDGYENILETGGASNRLRPNQFEVIFKELVETSKSTLFVFFSREKLRWGPMTAGQGRLTEINQIELRGLTESDADEYLKRAKIADQQIRISMIEAATVYETSKNISSTYPIMLSMQVLLHNQLQSHGHSITPADFQTHGSQFKEKCDAIAGRLLRSYGSQLEATLKRLSLARTFDFSLFSFVIKRFTTGLPVDEWPVVSSLAFISPMPTGGLYSFHSVIRQAFSVSLDVELARQTHEALAEFYSSESVSEDEDADIVLSQAVATPDAFYHLRHVDEGRALEWFQARLLKFRTCHLERYSEEMEEASTAIASRLFGRASDEHLMHLASYGINLLAQTRLDEAERVHRLALELATERYDPHASNYAHFLSALGTTLQARRSYAEAKDLFEQALSIQREEFNKFLRDVDVAARGDDNPLFSFLVKAASLLEEQGHYKEAERYHRDCVETTERVTKEGSSLRSYSLTGLGNNLTQQGRYQEAEAIIRSAIEIEKRNVDPSSSDGLVMFSTLTSNLELQGRLEDAEVILREVMELAVASRPSGHRDVSRALTGLALNLDSQGRLVEAEALMRRAIDINKTRMDPSNVLSIGLISRLAQNLDRQNRLKEGEVLHQEAITAIKGPLLLNTITSAPLIRALAINLEAQGRLAESRIYRERALVNQEAVFGIGHKETIDYISELANCASACGFYDDADSLYRRALQTLEEQPSKDLGRILGEKSAIAINFEGQEKYLAAEVIHKEVLEEAQRVFGNASSITAVALSRTGSNLDLQERFLEARDFHLIATNCPADTQYAVRSIGVKQALAINSDNLPRREEAVALHQEVLMEYEALPDPLKPKRLDLLSNLARSLQSTGKIREAEKMFRQVVKGASNNPNELPQDNDLAMALRDLGDILAYQMKFVEAEVLHRRASMIWESHGKKSSEDLCNEHGFLANSLNGQGKFRDAGQLYDVALSLITDIRGSDHRNTILLASARARNMDDQGRHAVAEAIHDRNLEILGGSRGGSHREFAFCCNAKALSLEAQNEFVRAETEHRRAIRIVDDWWAGSAHNDVVWTRRRLAQNLYFQGRYVEAKDLMGEAHVSSMKLMGSEGLATIIINGLLGEILDRLGDHDEASPKLHEAYAKLEAQLGPGHLYTAQTIFGLAQHYYSIGDRIAGNDLGLQANSLVSGWYGSDHWRTRRIKKWLSEHSSHEH